MDEEDRVAPNLSAELLKFHHRFGHCQFRKLQNMVGRAILPKRMEKCTIPVRSSCLYVRVNRRPWRQRFKNNMDESNDPEMSEDLISVYQLKTPTPGLIAQILGFLITKRYQ